MAQLPGGAARDYTQAIEIRGTNAPDSWTNRWILYAEHTIGYTDTAGE